MVLVELIARLVATMRRAIVTATVEAVLLEVFGCVIHDETPILAGKLPATTTTLHRMTRIWGD